jgi:pilus assembly protein CpaF
MSLYRRLRGGEEEGPMPDVAPEPTRAERLRLQVQQRLAADMPDRSPSDEVWKSEVRERISALLRDEPDLGPLERENLVGALYAQIVGLGPLQPLLEDPSVNEIMVNGPAQVYVERAGRLQRTAVRFRDDREILELIERIVAPLGRRIDESSPMVDARLKDGSRVNAIIPPLALRGPSLTIRKFPERALTMDDLEQIGTVSGGMVELLRSAVRGRLNIVVSGGTASGKTTLLNSLSAFIPSDERIVTIEDAAELRLQQDHVVALETRPANLEGRGEVTIRQLVRNALRMRPDRIVVGEVRAGEALDMLQAMNTGHDGSLTTVHANAPRDVLSRIETMVLMAGFELPVRAIREQIASALDLIVHAQRMRDGSRRVTHITEVQGMEGEVIVLQDLFRYRPGDGFAPTGLRPRFLERLETYGHTVDPHIFQTGGGRDA